ncbi:MAG: host attachment protein [Verrucomicrobiota bacterium]
MKKNALIVANLEELKAYGMDDDPLYSSPRLELIDQFHTGAHRKLVDEATDLAGRFPRASVARDVMGGMSIGERHNIELEKRKRCTRQLAGRINSLLQDPEVERCFLAASREMNHSLLQALTPQVRAKIGIAVAADLTKVSKANLLGHFKTRNRAA